MPMNNVCQMAEYRPISLSIRILTQVKLMDCIESLSETLHCSRLITELGTFEGHPGEIKKLYFQRLWSTTPKELDN